MCWNLKSIGWSQRVRWRRKFAVNFAKFSLFYHFEIRSCITCVHEEFAAWPYRWRLFLSAQFILIVLHPFCSESSSSLSPASSLLHPLPFSHSCTLSPAQFRSLSLFQHSQGEWVWNRKWIVVFGLHYHPPGAIFRLTCAFSASSLPSDTSSLQ